MTRGRPTLHDQKKIKEIIFTYYENNIEPITASRKTGHDYKTILKYYGLWNREIFKSEKNDFLMRIKITKERNLLMLDNKIISLIQEQKRIESQIDDALQIGNTFNYEKLVGLKLKIFDQLLKILSVKTNLIGTATADVIIHQKEAHT